MTTAARPTFAPAQGSVGAISAQRCARYQTAHTKLKYRQAQGARAYTHVTHDRGPQEAGPECPLGPCAEKQGGARRSQGGRGNHV